MIYLFKLLFTYFFTLNNQKETENLGKKKFVEGKFAV